MAQPIIDAPEARGQRLRMSYEEFLAWADEDRRAEWVDGEVAIFMPPRPGHTQLGHLLATLLSIFARLNDLGEAIPAPVGMRLPSRPSFREPDVLFVARAHLDRITSAWIEGPADLVIEIVSDDSVTRDRVEKLAEYAAAGIPEYWLFDPRPGHRDAAFHRLTDQGRYEPIPPDAAGRLRSTVVPGFWLDPAWLWQDPLPDPLTLLMRITPDALRAFVLASDSESNGGAA
jgi:Uma2 family endonuclease